MTLVDIMWEPDASAVPRHFDFRMSCVKPDGQLFNGRRIRIATHETDTGNHTIVGKDKSLQRLGGQRSADVLPQVAAVATRTVTGTA